MSASPGDGPGAAELADRFPISPMEAQMIADAMTPIQDLTGVGSSVGSVMESAPGAGPPFVGSVLKTVSVQVNLASQSAETLARAIDFYVTSQTGSAEELFPPPAQMAEQIRQDAEPLRNFIEQGPGGQ